MGIMTFKNLPEEKRIRILQAAKKEFSRVPVNKSLISNIVNDAKIPRGSFYQYFSSVEELFVVLLGYLYGKDQKYFSEFLNQNNNDFFLACKNKFSYLIDRISVDNNRQFNINLLKYFLEENNSTIIPELEEMKMRIDSKYLPDNLLQNQFAKEIMSIIEMINIHCISKYLLNNIDKEDIKIIYNRHIDAISYTFSRGNI